MPEARQARRPDHDIRPLSVAGAEAVAAGMAKIDPWARLGFTKERLVASMIVDNVATAGFEAVVEGVPAALITFVPGWLYGPYIRLLAVLPPAQGHGLGSALIDRLADVARKHGQANLWVCASAFNDRALAFYERRGFRRIGVLEGLVTEGEDEVLLRRQL
jgi:diamine N-acetyltransferase